MKPRLSFRHAVIILTMLTLMAAQSWGTYHVFTSRFPGGNDFYARWANGCALVWSGTNPYSDEAMLEAQMGMHGHPAQVGEDRAAFAYPLYTLFFFWPLCYVQPYPLVQAIWMTLMLYALLAAAVLTARVAGWRPGYGIWGATLMWSVFNYPHFRAIVLGQMATLVFLGLALTLWALRRKKDILAGAVLAVTTIKPQMSFLLVPWILWWSAWRRRWSVWAGFCGAMVLLVVISLALVPTWIADFIEDVRSYRDSWTQASGSSEELVQQGKDETVTAQVKNYRSLIWMITRHLLKLGPAAEVVSVTVLSAYVLLVSWQRRQADWRGFLWVTGLVLIATNFVAPRTATTHYTMLLLPLFAWFAQLERGLGRKGRWAVLGVELALLVGQWLIFLTTVEGTFEAALVYLPFPLIMLLVELASRGQDQALAPLESHAGMHTTEPEM